MAVAVPTSKTWIQLFLTILHKTQVQIEYHVLPKTVESLLAVPSCLESSVIIRDSFEKGSCPATPPKKIGQLLYYGISRAIEGISAGLEDKWRYFKDLSLIDLMDPKFLTPPFKTLLLGDSGVALEKLLSQKPSSDSEQEADPLKVLLHIFADGFSPYSNCTHNYWSVYGLITGFVRKEKVVNTKGDKIFVIN